MKKLIFVFIIILISFTLTFYFKPITFKLLTGAARVLEKDSEYQLKIDNKLYNQCVYKSTESFDKKRDHNFLIIYLEDLKIKSDFKIVVVNINEKVVGYACNSLYCYDKIFGNLVQSDMGSFYTILEDSNKGIGFSSNLKIENKEIEFYIPSAESKNFHIQLSKKIK